MIMMNIVMKMMIRLPPAPAILRQHLPGQWPFTDTILQSTLCPPFLSNQHHLIHPLSESLAGHCAMSRALLPFRKEGFFNPPQLFTMLTKMLNDDFDIVGAEL